ncbi:hypothetical protein CDL12_18440 [Handroanthus impetiginosus]|uniref:LOB domain-containing protein n=1 Tax=Handroanthus impetiginosus TaxID=429701 RepID=A0A2G9GUM3_9LAMI|nr:hypothetical protein CDL12_18440 [Handroanthus impetiginosus]
MHRTTNNTSACATCKHQRKKCTEKCILAPFFPAEKTQEFQAVHKVFGVSNVTKIIKNLKEEDRARAIDSLVWEALSRQREPVLGPYGEYRRVFEELRFYKTQFQQFQQIQNQGRIMGWNNNNGMTMNRGGMINNNNSNNNENNTLNNIHGNGNFFPYSYSSHHIQEDEKIRAERDNASAIIIPQQHLANGFNQQFFIAGQYNRMETKSMESTLWEGSSS